MAIRRQRTIRQWAARFAAGALAGAVAAAAAAAAPPASQPDQAGGDRPTLGRIVGVIRPASAVRSVKCLDRDAKMSYAAAWDARAGRIEVAKLAPGRRYDLEVTTTDGRTFVGVDLSYEEDPLLRLARRQVGDVEEPGPLTDEDRKGIDDIVRVETFEDQHQVLALRGNHQRATALVQLRRTREFHGGQAGENIRRVEIWHFKFQHGGWEKIANAEKVLLREPKSAREIDEHIKREVYVADLGGLLVEAGKTAAVDVTLPGFAADAPASQPGGPAERK